MARRPTATSNFGVSRRENHDATAFYARFVAPVLSDDDDVSREPRAIDEIFEKSATCMDEVPDASVALVVTSPPYFAGKEYEEALGHGEIPATYLQYLDMLGAVFAECVKKLEPGGRIAINVANLGRRPYRSLSSDVVGILERDLKLLLRGEVIWQKARGFRRLVRVGIVPEGDEPGAARPHRARGHREQGPVRPRVVDERAQGAEPAVRFVARA